MPDPTAIKSISAYPLRYPEPHDHGAIRYVTLARVESEDGMVGWGECVSQMSECCLAVKTIIEQGFAPLLIGDNSRNVETCWQKMVDRVWWYGPEGTAAFALSAIDMALWDLKGKALGQPVCHLIGGQLRDKVVAMASIHMDMDNLDWTVNEFSTFRKQGYNIVKGGWGTRPESVFGMDRKRDLELVRRVREVIGDDIDLVLDVLGARVRWDTKEAVARFREMEPYRLLWIEEPLPPKDYRSHALLRSMVTTRIGTGEQEWTPDGYLRLIEGGGVDVVQLDPGRCQGITGCMRAVKLIEAANLKFSAHTWSSALNTAASVHVLAASRHGWCMDFKPHESPMQHELVSDPWVQENGFIAVRNTPGLGVTVKEETVRKYSF
ncbi:MAG: mandelate racemase/muconate lactonizing enzyme family protein [Chthoniobacterales bacterium]